MKESVKAVQAWADYLAMGPERSLRKLLTRYQNANNAPTRRFKSLADWSRTFGWDARVHAIAEREAREAVEREVEARAALQAEGIANRKNRVDALNDRWRRMQHIIEERAADPSLADIPGGPTGLVVAEPMLVKVQGEIGEDGRFMPVGRSEIIYTYKVDTGVLKEIREHEKQAAVELGQWAEKVQHTGDDDHPVRFTLQLSNDGDFRVREAGALPETE